MNRKIAALYGAGKKSLIAEKVLRSHAPHIAIPYLVENRDFSKLGQDISALSDARPLRVVSLEALQRLYASGECTMVIVPNAYHLFDLREIRETLEHAGIDPKDIYVVPYNRLHAPHDHTGPGLEPLVPIDESIFIHHLDVHIVDHCNLQCTACAHFSNTVNRPVIYESTLLRESLNHLRDIIPNTHSISLLGGEPLLHPDLGEIILAARGAFPYAKITINTNGILLKKLSNDILDSIRENRIHLRVSLYPLLYNKIDSMQQFLHSKKIYFTITKSGKFERRFTREKLFDAARQFSKCGHDMCLRGSRIGYCVIALFADYYNTYFARSDAPRLPEDPGVAIFAHTTGASLLNALQQPLELCAHCVSRDAGQMFFEKWKNGGANLKPDDWFIKFPYGNGIAPCNTGGGA